MTQKPKGKGSEILRAISEFVIVCMLIAGAGFGGYFWGTHQRMAPIAEVPPGTPGAISQPAIANLPPAAAHSGQGQPSATAANGGLSIASTAPPAINRKYWISSSGSDYIGYSITAKVNGTPVDNFFGPGKTVNITNLVKHGDNTVVFEAKSLGSDYNKHAGDGSSLLTVQVVNGQSVQENYKSSDVLASYARSATDSGDSSDTFHFNGD
ncbi:MAG TPA: hypothetical protein V6D22_11465 [Candidatus Obscuribacterales bacterium]